MFSAATASSRCWSGSVKASTACCSSPWNARDSVLQARPWKWITPRDGANSKRTNQSDTPHACSRSTVKSSLVR